MQRPDVLFTDGVEVLRERSARGVEWTLVHEFESCNEMEMLLDRRKRSRWRERSSVNSHLANKDWTQQGWRESTRHSDGVVRRKVGLLVLCS